MCQPVTLRLRATFIDFRPEQSEMEGTRRSLSSPPAIFRPEEPPQSFERCSNEYLKGLVAKTMKMSNKSQMLSKHGTTHSEKHVAESTSPESKGFQPVRYLQCQQRSEEAPGHVARRSQTSECAANGLPVVETLMVRNIPCKMTLKAMINLIDSHGFAGTYDFLHLPGRGCPFSNLGYAFINFSNAATVDVFMAKFQGVAFSTLLDINSEKVLQIIPARAQGFAENIAKVHHIMSKNDDTTLFVSAHGGSYLL